MSDRNCTALQSTATLARWLLVASLLCCGARTANAHSLGDGAIYPLTPPIAARLKRSLQLDTAFADKRSAITSVVDRLHDWEFLNTLTGCFFPENPDKRDGFIATTQRWIANTRLTLDFGSAPNYRDCSGLNQEHVRVSFRVEKVGNRLVSHWSAVGSYGLTSDYPGATMNINPGLLKNDFEVVVLHEMGHALGLQHEHQHRDANCAAQINEQQAFREYHYMPQEQVRAMFSVIVGDEPDQFDFLDYDRWSIMHYSFKEKLFITGTSATCYVPRNTDLSDGDKAAIAKYYGANAMGWQVKLDLINQRLASLKLTAAEKVSFGEEATKALALTAKKTAVTFKFDPSPTPFVTKQVADCPSRGTWALGVSCKLAVDGSELSIRID